jgi:hypothetical protein
MALGRRDEHLLERGIDVWLPPAHVDAGDLSLVADLSVGRKLGLDRLAIPFLGNDDAPIGMGLLGVDPADPVDRPGPAVQHLIEHRKRVVILDLPGDAHQALGRVERHARIERHRDELDEEAEGCAIRKLLKADEHGLLPGREGAIGAGALGPVFPR